jgi:energy-coupling factor transporter transmembrane protein EcfT
MRLPRSQLRPASYLAFLAWALLLVALLPDGRLGFLLAAVVAFSWFNQRAGLRVLVKRRFWLFILSTLVVAALILGEADVRWGIVRLSREGLTLGTWMALRAATLMLAFSVSLGSLSVAQMISLFDGLGLRGLGFALGVALNLGPVLNDVVEATYHTMRLRGGLRRPLQNAQLFLITVVANALRYGDDVVKAASARAFDPAASLPPLAPLLGRADEVFMAGLVVAGGVLIGY